MEPSFDRGVQSGFSKKIGVVELNPEGPMHWYGIQKSYQYRTSKYVKRRLFAGRYQSAGPHSEDGASPSG
ncbi:hypothetical protein GGQ18_001817 [Salinibacter ruber]|nr:hypothetical protein [Salinibacter ruber]